jgi:hypothetical protein
MVLAVTCSLTLVNCLMSEKKIVRLRRSAWSAPLAISRLTSLDQGIFQMHP